jgi:multicomponent Na+:H+ antiporter subunit G
MMTSGTIVLLIGLSVLLLASCGLFVFQDALSRQHAATKAGSLGIVFIMTGTALIGGDWSWAWRVVVIIIGVWATLPVASHVLARAALHEQHAQEDQPRA